MITNTAQILIIISGLWLVFVSVLMLVKPHTASCGLRKAASTNFINYSELTLRSIWGIALVVHPTYTMFPDFFNIFGIFVIISSAILFVVPRKWHAKYAVWWADRLSSTHLRIAAPFSFLFGILLIYAVV